MKWMCVSIAAMGAMAVGVVWDSKAIADDAATIISHNADGVQVIESRRPIGVHQDPGASGSSGGVAGGLPPEVIWHNNLASAIYNTTSISPAMGNSPPERGSIRRRKRSSFLSRATARPIGNSPAPISTPPSRETGT